MVQLIFKTDFTGFRVGNLLGCEIDIHWTRVNRAKKSRDKGHLDPLLPLYHKGLKTQSRYQGSFLLGSCGNETRPRGRVGEDPGDEVAQC